MIYHYQQSKGWFLPSYSSSEIAGLDKNRAVVLLPIASIEQHGPHLPVFTDSLIAMDVLERVCQQLPVDYQLLNLPLLAYGRSVEHAGFSGTISLTSETLLRVMMEIAESVNQMGFKRFVIFNSHGGNSELIDVAIRDIRQRFNLIIFGLHIFLRIGVPSYGLSEDELKYGIHAGDIETSIMLRAHPDLVNMDLAPDSLPRHLRQRGTPPFADSLNFAWITSDISRDGVLGNAQTADAERGEVYLAHAAQETVKLLNKIADFQFQ